MKTITLNEEQMRQLKQSIKQNYPWALVNIPFKVELITTYKITFDDDRLAEEMTKDIN